MFQEEKECVRLTNIDSDNAMQCFNVQEEEEGKECATRTLPKKQESKELEVYILSYPWIYF